MDARKQRARVNAVVRHKSGDYLADINSIVTGAFGGQNLNSLNLIDDERQYLVRPAPNAIEWVIDKSFCNVPSLFEMSRQYQVIRDFFQLRCPICNLGGYGDGEPGDCWGKSRDYLESEALLVWSAAYNDDACPRCRLTRSELVADGLLKNFNQFHGLVGQRAGKSITAALIGTYVEHRLYTIAHSFPGGFHAYLGIPSSELFEMTFLASNEVQGADTIWAKFRGFRVNSPWFQRYVPWVKEQEKAQLTPPGMEPWEYNEIDKKVVNQHPSVRLILNSLNSNSSGLRGRTRVFAAADEISHMQQTDSKLSADEVYVGLENSLRTVRSRVKLHGRLPWLGCMLSVTSPVSINDKGMKLLKIADKVEGMYAFKYATWEFNPLEPRENFNDEYAKDPIRAERDFGANPPTAANPLVYDVGRFKKLAIDYKLEPTARLETYGFQDPHGQDYIGVKYSDADIRRDWPRYVVFDAGKNFDAFAGVCAHGERVRAEDGTERIVTVYDWVMRILPGQGMEVFFDSVFDLVKKLKEKQNIVRVEFDRWNSVQIIQQIRQLGIRAEQVSTKDEDYKNFVSDAYAGLLRMLPPADDDVDDYNDWKVDPPFMRPQTCAIYELEGLERDPVTDKVSNPRKGERRGWSSNDVAQVCVHAHKLIREQGYVEKEGDTSKRAAMKRGEHESAQWLAAKQGSVISPKRLMGGVGQRKGGRGW